MAENCEKRETIFFVARLRYPPARREGEQGVESENTDLTLEMQFLEMQEERRQDKV